MIEAVIMSGIQSDMTMNFARAQKSRDPEPLIRDLGKSLDVMGVQLKKICSDALVPQLELGIVSRLSPGELSLLQKVAVSIELRQPLLFTDLQLSSFLPLLRFLCQSSGRDLVYLDANNTASLRGASDTLGGPTLLAIESIDSLCELPETAEAERLKTLIGLKQDRLLGTLADDIALIATARKDGVHRFDIDMQARRALLSSFVYTQIQEPAEDYRVGIMEVFSVTFQKSLRNALTFHDSEIRAVSLPLGVSIEQLPDWPTVDTHIRKILQEVSALIARGKLAPIDQVTISTVSHYPRIVGFLWHFFDGDLARTARRALTHTLCAHFAEPQQQAMVKELIGYVLAGGETANRRITLEAITAESAEKVGQSWQDEEVKDGPETRNQDSEEMASEASAGYMAKKSKA